MVQTASESKNGNKKMEEQKAKRFFAVVTVRTSIDYSTIIVRYTPSLFMRFAANFSCRIDEMFLFVFVKWILI